MRDFARWYFTWANWPIWTPALLGLTAVILSVLSLLGVGK